MIKLSIIIPNYNNQKYIELCINSILNQSFKDYEVIVIDDGSTDKSVEIIEQIAKKHSCIKLIKQYNQNASIARNRGIELAKGKYILFIDSDDYIYDEKAIGNMINKIGNNDLLICNYVKVDENNSIQEYYDINKEIIPNGDNLIQQYAFVSAVPTNKLFKTKIIHENNLFFDNVDIGQDLNFYIKYLAVCHNLIVTDDYSYCYRINSNGMTRKINYNLLGIIKSVEKINKFYQIRGIKENNVINSIAFINYCAQMTKIEKFSQRQDKKFIYNYFSYFIKKLKIDKDYIKTNSRLKKAIRFYKFTRLMKIIFLSRYYEKIKKVINKI